MEDQEIIRMVKSMGVAVARPCIPVKSSILK